jgi:hypothetical protein
MRLINQTKNSILADEVTVADNFFTRLNGLLGKKYLQKGKALIIRPCNTVHTFFMRFSIDVIFIDKKYKVIKIISCLKPFSFSGVCWKAILVIEFPSGTLNSSNVGLGDSLQHF